MAFEIMCTQSNLAKNYLKNSSSQTPRRPSLKFNLMILEMSNVSSVIWPMTRCCPLDRVRDICWQTLEVIILSLKSLAVKPVKLGHPEHCSSRMIVISDASTDQLGSIDVVCKNNNPSTNEQITEEAVVAAPQARAPRKMVSINDHVEVFDEMYISNKRKRKKMTMENWPSMKDETVELKPLKSILKVGSYRRN